MVLEDAAAVEDLDAVIMCVRDVYVSIRVDGKTPGVAEVTRCFSSGANSVE
jgi:N-acetylmuramic acid 6-phosphate (MurNAc-6-P) etherase